MNKLKCYFAYIRVSTAKQGSRGVSLQEQRAAIEKYAATRDLLITEWFEERITAAKRGRPLFSNMLSRLKSGEAAGVIIHKIDRGARNLRDWADIGELIDNGVEIHFANESLDLSSRGGRLSADIQAVVAADYIRNLREEAKKGIYGRLKQGIYPLMAPIGYLDCGSGKPKKIDPVRGPLVKKLFRLYATELYNIRELAAEARKIGLTNRNGGRVRKTGLWKTLRNPFYIGLMHIKRTNKTFQGIHEPLISPSLFDEVQRFLDGRSKTRKTKHNYTFRRLFVCANCGYSVIAERQKGHIYYRCHTRDCPTTSVREEWIHRVVSSRISTFSFPSPFRANFLEVLRERKKYVASDAEDYLASLELRRKQAEARRSRLIDLFVDNRLDAEVFETKQAELLREIGRIDELIAEAQSDSRAILKDVERILEHTFNASLSYKKASKAERRYLVETVASNRTVDGKKVFVELREPFCDLARYKKRLCSGVQRDRPRTSEAIIDHIEEFVRRKREEECE